MIAPQDSYWHNIQMVGLHRLYVVMFISYIPDPACGLFHLLLHERLVEYNFNIAQLKRCCIKNVQCKISKHRKNKTRIKIQAVNQRI